MDSSGKERSNDNSNEYRRGQENGRASEVTKEKNFEKLDNVKPRQKGGQGVTSKRKEFNYYFPNSNMQAVIEKDRQRRKDKKKSNDGEIDNDPIENADISNHHDYIDDDNDKTDIGSSDDSNVKNHINSQIVEEIEIGNDGEGLRTENTKKKQVDNKKQKQSDNDNIGARENSAEIRNKIETVRSSKEEVYDDDYDDYYDDDYFDDYDYDNDYDGNYDDDYDDDYYDDYDDYDDDYYDDYDDYDDDYYDDYDDYDYDKYDDDYYDDYDYDDDYDDYDDDYDDYDDYDYGDDYDDYDDSNSDNQN